MSVLEAVRAPVSATRTQAVPASTRDVINKLGSHRGLSLVAALGLFWPLMKAWNDIVSVPSAGIATVMLTGATLVLACAIASARSEETLDRLDRWLLVLGLLVLVAGAAAALQQMSGYDTDEAAFVQGAANLVVHGHDPYGANLIPSLSQFAVPAQFWTYTMNGGVVSTLGYPALPVLIAIPFVELTGGGQAVPIANLAILMFATVAMFIVLPRGWKSVAVVVCVGFPALSGFALAGDNAIVMMAALVVVAYRWRAVGQSGSLARGDRISAVALGLALSTNQLAWFLAPFLLVGIYLARSLNLGSRRAAAVTARYLGLAVATFVVINLPFILWGPVAWWQGIMAPLTQHALPYGQGIVGLTLFLHLGGGATDAYSYAAEFSYVALLAVYIFEYRRLSRCCFVLPTIALYASGRSLSGYWMVLLAVIVVGVVTADEGLLTHVGPRGPARTRRGRAQLTRRLLIGVLALPAVALLVIALTTPQPLTMHILGAHSDPQLRSVKQVIVEVRNSSGSALSPHFATDTRGQASPFWRVTRGPASLAPGAQATYTLLATDLGSVPANGTPFLLQAVTGEPRTISSSELFTQSGPAPGNW